MLWAVKLNVRNILPVTYLRFLGSLLQFVKKERIKRLKKKELKSSAFYSKSVIKRSSWNNGDISLFGMIFIV